MAADTGRYYVRVIDDVKRNDRCFTDGIGKISWGLAGRIAQKMNLQLVKKVSLVDRHSLRRFFSRLSERYSICVSSACRWLQGHVGH